MEKDNKNELIKGNGSTSHKTDITQLREQFKNKYAYEKGWNVNDLSDEQLNEIKSQKGYKAPGMICG